jgi:hypothetical protein
MLVISRDDRLDLEGDASAPSRRVIQESHLPKNSSIRASKGRLWKMS